MPKTYFAAALLAFALYGTAQVRGWSVLPSDAQEFERRRAEQRDEARGYRSGGGGGLSGHK